VHTESRFRHLPPLCLSFNFCIVFIWSLVTPFGLSYYLDSWTTVPPSTTMAPGALLETPFPSESINNTHRDGTALEATSDAIDTVNVLKASLKATLKTKSTTTTTNPQDANIYSSSQFDAQKDKSQFRQYEAACSRVRNFYREQHTKQTVSYNLQARHAFHSKTRAEMTVWEAMQKLNTLIDESDPDTELSQIEHLVQCAEAIRRDGKPRWMQLVGLIHDLGKLLFFFDAEGQWDVVGDTFPVGCAFDPRIIYPDTFASNPDTTHAVYSTQYGMYAPGCGLDNVMLSWGHDEYLYHVLKGQSSLPDEGLAMIRYHSFYPWHDRGAYAWMMDEGGKDQRMLEAVRAFNPYDLYSKSDEVPRVEELKVSFSFLFFPPLPYLTCFSILFVQRASWVKSFNIFLGGRSTTGVLLTSLSDGIERLNGKGLFFLDLVLWSLSS
jgi:inositol oxygenase